jgi:hypothetical protein
MYFVHNIHCQQRELSSKRSIQKAFSGCDTILKTGPPPKSELKTSLPKRRTYLLTKAASLECQWASPYITNCIYMGKSENERDIRAGNRNNVEIHHTCVLNNLASSVCNLQREIPYRLSQAYDVKAIKTV